MITEKRLIYKEDVLAMAWLADECEVVTALDIENMPTVDAVPVDEIKFLYCAIDKKGIPELKIQLGDRIFCLRRDNDPVDVVPVVRCKDCKHQNEDGDCDIHDDWFTRKPDSFCCYGERKDNE